MPRPKQGARVPTLPRNVFKASLFETIEDPLELQQDEFDDTDMDLLPKKGNAAQQKEGQAAKTQDPASSQKGPQVVILNGPSSSTPNTAKRTIFNRYAAPRTSPTWLTSIPPSRSYQQKSLIPSALRPRISIVQETSSQFRSRIVTAIESDFDALNMGRIIISSAVSNEIKNQILQEIVEQSDSCVFRFDVLAPVNKEMYADDDDARCYGSRLQLLLLQSATKPKKSDVHVVPTAVATFTSQPSISYFTKDLKIPISAPRPFEAGLWIKIASIKELGFPRGSAHSQAYALLEKILHGIAMPQQAIRLFTFKSEVQNLVDYERYNWNADPVPGTVYVPLPPTIVHFLKDALLTFFGYNRPMFDESIAPDDLQSLIEYQELGSTESIRWNELQKLKEERWTLTGSFFKDCIQAVLTDLRPCLVREGRWLTPINKTAVKRPIRY